MAGDGILRYRGVDRRGRNVVGTLGTRSSLADQIEEKFGKGWRWLEVMVDGEEVAGIGPHPDTGKRTWWSERNAETPHSRLPRHCAVCGIDWPEGHHGICRSCGAGLPCRADTTDSVAPDPPCAGSRHRLPQNTDEVMTMSGWTKRVEPSYVVIDEVRQSEPAPTDNGSSDQSRPYRPDTP